MKLPLSEAPFYTIQGEGQFSGVPSLFIRFTGCNLRCWWCDTPYTSWKPESRPIDLADVLDDYDECEALHVVITGGEPMLYPDKLKALIDGLRKLRPATVVTIETNGTIFDLQVTPDLWSISPKLDSSFPKPEDAREFSLHAANSTHAHLYQFTQTQAIGAKVQFKFVVTSKVDVEAVASIASTYRLPDSMIWLMPEGITRDAVLDKAGWIAEECKARGWNMTLRNHTLIWGNKRGV